MRAEEVHEVITSGLRGRGGAGFQTGTWNFLAKPEGVPRYLVCEMPMNQSLVHLKIVI